MTVVLVAGVDVKVAPVLPAEGPDIDHAVGSDVDHGDIIIILSEKNLMEGNDNKHIHVTADSGNYRIWGGGGWKWVAYFYFQLISPQIPSFAGRRQSSFAPPPPPTHQ